MKDNPANTESIKVEPIGDAPTKEVKANLAEFLLSLIQAFLRTGYYTPDHPESKNAKTGLYEGFQALLTQKDELTFLVRDDSAGKKVLIEGVFPEPRELQSVMLRGMAEMYTPKFVTFLDRKDLISLTLKGTMSSTEFDHFIDLMGEPTFKETQERGDKERFVQTLKERGIFNLSYIFKEELLGKNRAVPWRARIALSRLKKDFKAIPFYQDLDVEGLRRVRRQIVQDVVRPVRSAEVIYPIMMNTDLAETEHFTELEIDEEMITCLSDELLFQLSQTLLKEILRQRNRGSFQEKSMHLAKKIASSLTLTEIKGGESILREYYKHKLISFEELPKATQRSMKSEEDLNKFLQHRNDYLRRFDETQDIEGYMRFARFFKRIIPELARQDQHKETLKIITLIDHHSNKKEEISAYARQILDEISKGDMMGVLKGKLLTGQRETCQAIVPIFSKLGKRSISCLFDLLKESIEPFVHKSACEILLKIDPSTIDIILEELNKEGIETEFAVRIIRALGETECVEQVQPLIDTLMAYLSRENPRLREEALWAYYKVMGAKGEKVFLVLLNDPDFGIQKRAIQCLGRIKSQIALEKFLDILKGLKDAPSSKIQQILPTLFSALSFYGNIVCSDGRSLEDFLLETLDKQLNIGPLKFLKKDKKCLSEGAVAAVCGTLGEIGTNRSSAILQKLEKQDNPLWNKKAGEALSKITEREKVSQDRERINPAP
jgi:HEAT repeat protein